MVSPKVAERATVADILLQRLIAQIERVHPGTIDAIAGPVSRKGVEDAEDAAIRDALDAHISRILGNAAGQVYGGGSVA